MDAQQVPLIQEVQKIVDERVPAADFQQQVDRWNRYQEALDKVKRQCEIERVRFRRRLTTSYSERRLRNIYQIAAAAMFGYALWVSVAGIQAYLEYTSPFINIYAPDTWNSDDEAWLTASQILYDGVMGAYAASMIGFFMFFNKGHLPEKIKFQCKPVLNIDDLYYLQRFVHGMAKERHDPKVVLPELTMELPQSWIKQQSLLSVMDTMKNIKL